MVNGSWLKDGWGPGRGMSHEPLTINNRSINIFRLFIIGTVIFEIVSPRWGIKKMVTHRYGKQPHVPQHFRESIRQVVCLSEALA